MKKIILILTVILIVLVGATYLLTNWLKSSQKSKSQTDEVLPTGIIMPTESLVAGELDIVTVEPKDMSKNVGLDTPIKITFSKTFSFDDIEFFIGPDTPHKVKIESNNLIITPETKWETGTQYTYSINFADNPQKVRLYRFITTGPTQEFLPDTQPKDLYKKELDEQKTERPDIYVANNTPYESGTFSVRANFESKPPAHYYLIVTKKINDEEQVKQDVNVWLQQLDLSNEQIASLDIRYE